MAKSDISKELTELTAQLQLQNSPTRRFFLGIITGVGTALGATIVASLIILILARVVSTIDEIPFLDKIIDSNKIDQLIETRTKK